VIETITEIIGSHIAENKVVSAATIAKVPSCFESNLTITGQIIARYYIIIHYFFNFILELNYSIFRLHKEYR
jgi:hypothetical protein